MDSPTLVPLRVRVLGGFELRSADGGDLTPPGRKLRALVALLALAPAGGWSRERSTALLWDGRDEEQARGSLRQALAELRRTLGDSVLLTDREMAAFDAAAMRSDAMEFARLAAAGELEQAASLYRGDWLDGVGLPDAGFADWLQVERTRLHDLAAGVLARLLATQSGEAAVATAQRLLQLEPTHEEAHRALMRLYAAQGERSQALRQYQLCRDSLQRDLGVKPEPETERLCKEIQSSARRVAAAPAGLANNGAVGGVPAAGADDDRPLEQAPVMPRSLWTGLAAAAVVALALAVGATWWFWPETPPSGKPAVAVLPFDNFAGDEASRRFADGLTEDIITDSRDFPSSTSSPAIRPKSTEANLRVRSRSARPFRSASWSKARSNATGSACGSRRNSSTRRPARLSGPSGGTGRSVMFSPFRPRSPSRSPTGSAAAPG